MKKAILLFLGIMSFASLKANDGIESAKKNINTNGYENTISFVEKGVQFHVFLDGDFEFETPNSNRRYSDYNGNRIRRNTLRIDRDYKGNIKRVGRNYIRYDYKGNVTKIGNVRLYYRRGLLRRVGDLRISYNRWGDPYYTGNVNRYNMYDDDFHFSINLGSIFNYNDRYFYKKEFRNNYRKFKEDNNYYYYRANKNAKVGKRNQVIKRRKSTVKNRNNNTYKRKNATPKKRVQIKKEVNKRKADKKQESRRRS